MAEGASFQRPGVVESMLLVTSSVVFWIQGTKLASAVLIQPFDMGPAGTGASLWILETFPNFDIIIKTGHCCSVDVPAGTLVVCGKRDKHESAELSEIWSSDHLSSVKDDLSRNDIRPVVMQSASFPSPLVQQWMLSRNADPPVVNVSVLSGPYFGGDFVVQKHWSGSNGGRLGGL